MWVCLVGNIGGRIREHAKISGFVSSPVPFRYTSTESCPSSPCRVTPNRISVMAPISTATMGTQNGHGDNGQIRVAPRPGIYVPTVAFFKPNEDVDIEATKKHAVRLAATGIQGIVTHGSNGEAAHLDHDERIAITRATRQALDENGHEDLALIVGCGAQSTRETIKLCRNAATAGGNFALVLPASYFASLLTPKLLLDHYRNIADASPIPILIYNFPAVQSGIDLNSDQIIELAQHPKIVGVKLTCGNTGKLARVAAATADLEFRTMGGSSDFLLQTLIAGGHGVIAGLGNLSPALNVRTMQLYQQGDVEKAKQMQAVLARADWIAIKGGFVAVKVGLEKFYGYGGVPRLPCAMPDKAQRMQVEEGFAEMMEHERSSMS